MNYIFTCQETSSDLALEELTKKVDSFNFIKWINGGIGLAQIDLNSKEFAKFIYQKPIIFIRHIFKVDSKLNLLSNWKYHLIKAAISKLDKSKTFSIQLRHNTDYNIVASEIIEELSSKIVNNGYILDVKNCEQVISIFIFKDEVYFGIDNVENNLSKFKGGVPHYFEGDDFVSRAEFKMVEALDVFKIDTSKLIEGVDFGAAPGGWTKVLANHGVNMVAIDPANMNTKVLGLKNVVHKQMTIQEYFFNHNNKKFDIIVNDMKMDVRKSAKITMDFYNNLNKDGIVIMTFKLPKNYNLSLIEKDLSSFNKKFKLVSARQLFYNRSEITVVLKKEN